MNNVDINGLFVNAGMEHTRDSFTLAEAIADEMLCVPGLSWLEAKDNVVNYLKRETIVPKRPAGLDKRN